VVGEISISKEEQVEALDTVPYWRGDDVGPSASGGDGVADAVGNWTVSSADDAEPILGRPPMMQLLARREYSQQQSGRSDAGSRQLPTDACGATRTAQKCIRPWYRRKTYPANSVL
jgi:hypothetical protein